MVKILNGEIVQDNDPRLKQRSAANGSSSGSRVRGVHDTADASTPVHDRRPPNASTKEVGGPLDFLAEKMGLADKFVTIPALPFANLSESKVGVIYIIAVFAATVLLKDLRALLVAIGIYVITKKSESRSE